MSNVEKGGCVGWLQCVQGNKRKFNNKVVGFAWPTLFSQYLGMLVSWCLSVG